MSNFIEMGVGKKEKGEGSREAVQCRVTSSSEVSSALALYNAWLGTGSSLEALEMKSQ